jgi:hypothetical protein
MNIRLRAAICLGVMSLLFLTLCSIPVAGVLGIRLRPLEALLEAAGVLQYAGCLTSTLMIFAMFGMWLVVVWSRSWLPPRCRQPQCRGFYFLTESSKSPVYVCNICGDVFDAGLKAGDSV